MLQIKLILSLRMRDLLLWINPSEDLMRSGLEPEGRREKPEVGGWRAASWWEGEPSLCVSLPSPGVREVSQSLRTQLFPVMRGLWAPEGPALPPLAPSSGELSPVKFPKWTTSHPSKHLRARAQLITPISPMRKQRLQEVR